MHPIFENSTACTMSMPKSSANLRIGRDSFWIDELSVRQFKSQIKLNTLRSARKNFPSNWENIFYGEFDPGSGRTLAACLTHASRTMKPELAPVD